MVPGCFSIGLGIGIGIDFLEAFSDGCDSKAFFGDGLRLAYNFGLLNL